MEGYENYVEILKRGLAACSPWAFIAGRVRSTRNRQQKIVRDHGARDIVLPSQDEIEGFLDKLKDEYERSYRDHGCVQRNGNS